MEYTKGEWKAKKNALGTWTIHTDLEHIGQIDRHYNANLIAAAPDCHRELANLVERIDRGLAIGEVLDLKPARQALAKAEDK